MKEQFLNEVKIAIADIADDETIRELMNRISAVSADYTIERSGTELALVDDTPDALKAFLVTKKIEGMAVSSIELYANVLREFFRYISKNMEDITVNDVRTYLYLVQKERGICNSTLNTRRSIVSSFLEWSANEGYIGKNPARAIKKIKCSAEPREPLSGIEMELLRNACADSRDKAMVEFFYTTGCRVSEMVNLKISDVDFMKKEVILLGKGNKYRKGYINPRAEVALKKYIEEKEPSCDSSVFSSSRYPYKGIGKRAIENRIAQLAKDAGIERKVFPHLIRHTTATDILNRGMDITEVQKLLGHANVNTTLIYAKVDEQRTKQDHVRCVL